jgi:hypothetical protein
MLGLLQLHEHAAARGEGLRPELLALLRGPADPSPSLRLVESGRPRLRSRTTCNPAPARAVIRLCTVNGKAVRNGTW